MKQWARGQLRPKGKGTTAHYGSSAALKDKDVGLAACRVEPHMNVQIFGDDMVRHVVRVLRPSARSRQMAFAAEGQNASSRTARAIKLQRRSESPVQPVQRSHGGYESTPCDRSVL